MSGLEVVGVVLGAFPLLIEALGQYEEVGRRYGFWRRIRPEYRKCTHDLKYHSDVFRMNLRQLLLPQLVDDDMIEKMITNPGGPDWKAIETADMLRAKLQKSYSTYLEIMDQFQKTMDELRRELALESDMVQSKMDSPDVQPGPRNSQVLLLDKIRNSFSKSNRDYQAYRLKFSNGEATRRRLLDELKEHNSRLEKLLLNSDKEAQIISKRNSQTASFAYERSLCEFWRKATNLFRVICGSISCGCINAHQTSILLQHPKWEQESQPEIHVVLMTQREQDWGCCKAKIELTREHVVQSVASTPLEDESQGANQGTKPPAYTRLDENITLKPAIRIRHSSDPHRPAKKALFIDKDDNGSSHDTDMASSKPITNLCEYLKEQKHDHGYLQDDECRYQIYPGASMTVPKSYIVTLRQVLNEHGHSLGRSFSRRQRYALALILASSFVQLTESPWFSSHWSDDDVIFLSNTDQACQLQMDQPHVRQKLMQLQPGSANSPLLDGLGPGGHDSLSKLAIALLELCFGSTLESHPYRREWPEGQTPKEKAAFDRAAALDWLKDVNDEAGQEYANAVAWCLVGSRTLPGDGSTWRKEMIQRVIRPLDACHGYLTQN
ncbi:hypothetical protein F4808DRAFT_274931 [Astrocystis sublimbata]|nr:hypothetical protein F4808DRAFT_274931 [Astrocystis sublimbata]